MLLIDTHHDLLWRQKDGGVVIEHFIRAPLLLARGSYELLGCHVHRRGVLIVSHFCKRVRCGVVKGRDIVRGNRS